jgi:hypothetical protein
VNPLSYGKYHERKVVGMEKTSWKGAWGLDIGDKLPKVVAAIHRNDTSPMIGRLWEWRRLRGKERGALTEVTN